ncbi:MAG: hypothetical protein EWM73_02005 [Nitrospira sp.]|nr:MAG: hypothetical protein EWM73_02005 [Nitrospira sp.]
MNWLLRLFLIPGRVRHRWENRKRIKITRGLIETLRSHCQDAEKYGFKNHAVVYNAALFVVLLEQDLSAYSAALYYANTKWHQQFAARGMAVLLYEAAEDVPAVIGRDYRDALRSLGLGDSWIQALNVSATDFNKFRQEHAAFLKRIRNYVGAHREKNALAQLEVHESLDHMEVFRLGAQFSEPLRSLVNFKMALTQYLKHPGVLLREALKTTEGK